ncbi:unnamed protein product [Caenorhabditis sp. 36 PRJEB53466]|nr:unnamed protein product [Caenorhabditis sp. 36 PRJEB53466]
MMWRGSVAQPELDDDEWETTLARYNSTTQTTTTSTMPTTTKDYCHCDMEIYGVDDLEGVLKSPNYPGSHCNSGRCIYKILPHPNKTVRLNVQTASFSTGTVLKFWNIFDVNGKEFSVFHSELEDHERYYSNVFEDYSVLTTAKNVGFKVIFEPKKNSQAYTGFKITFERFENDGDTRVCPDPKITVGETMTTIVNPIDFSFPSGCVFLLSPTSVAAEHQVEEMFIDINTPSNTFVGIRSYDESGFFAKDIYSDLSRVKLVDASRVELLIRRLPSKKGAFKFPKITAKLMKQVLVDKVDTGAKKLVPLLMISANCTISEDDNLKLASLDSSRLIFRTSKKEMVPTKFLRPMIISQQDLRVVFSASDKVQRRYFEMNITRVFVPPECVCSLFDDKEYKGAGWVLAPIPARCKILHCHWKFSTGYFYPPKFISIEFFMSKPAIGDKVYIITDKITEEYGSQLLSHKRSLTSSASPIEFTFSRFNHTATADAVLNVTWTVVEACTCAPDKFQVEVDKPVVITSPNYPEMYCPNLVCRHTFYAPKGHYLEVIVDYADLERYHDFLKIYDGNGTIDPMMARISGIEKNFRKNSTGDTVFFLFMSDENISNKGFHANLIAHPKIVEDAPAAIHWLILFGLALVICLFSAIAVYFVVRKKPKTPKFTTLQNPTVSYESNQSTGSDRISIRYNSGTEMLPDTSSGTEII